MDHFFICPADCRRGRWPGGTVLFTHGQIAQAPIAQWNERITLAIPDMAQMRTWVRVLLGARKKTGERGE